MIYRDNQKNRLLYFATYTAYVFILSTIKMIFVFSNKDEKEIVK